MYELKLITPEIIIIV